MQFVRLPRGTRVPSGSQVPALPGFAYLIEDRWNDFGYVTQFYLVLIDHDGSPHDIGNVRIGGFGVPVDWDAAPSLPDRFERLDAAFFSLAREATYYERLQQLGLMYGSRFSPPSTTWLTSQLCWKEPATRMSL